MVKLSAFADEVADDLGEQVGFLVSEGIGYIELRFVNGKNVMDLGGDELKEAKKLLEDNGIGVSAIGSPIGKVRIDEPFDGHLEKFKHAVELAQFFETRMIRMFSYYPPEGEKIEDYRKQVIVRMLAKVEAIGDADVVMVHENETGIYGYSAENCVDLMKAVDSPKLRLAYDPANFVWGQEITDNVSSCWGMMKPYVAHVHIKDWRVGETTASMPGEGDGQIRELMIELAAMGYDGFMTMEPHLSKGEQFGGTTERELYSAAIAAVRSICRDVGLDLQ